MCHKLMLRHCIEKPIGWPMVFQSRSRESCCTFIGEMSDIGPPNDRNPSTSLTAWVGWNASQNTYSSRLEQSWSTTGKQGSCPLYSPPPQQPSLTTLKPEKCTKRLGLSIYCWQPTSVLEASKLNIYMKLACESVEWFCDPLPAGKGSRMRS